MNPLFWHGRRVLLTGHTGFKGAWLSLWLQSLGAELTGLALDPPSSPSLFEMARVSEGMNSLRGDIRNEVVVQQTMRACRPEVVIHMAAQSLVQDSYERPLETYAINVMGTAHVLEAARLCDSVRAVVVVTSDKCYLNRGDVPPYKEEDPLGGHDPYSSSKACAEIVAAAYRLSFFQTATSRVGIATARAGNVIGGGDWARNRLVPDLLRAFAVGETATLRNPDAVRPWQHVLEPLRAYLVLAQHLYEAPAKAGDAWNFGPSPADAVEVGEVARKLAQWWGDGAAFRVHRRPDAAHEAVLLTLDAGKARAQLGWQPLLDLDRALCLSVEWTRQVRGGATARTVTLAQIAAYQELAQEQNHAVS